MFEQKNVKYILEKINKDYFLPAIQRDYVWEENQIINLFDSILKGYPIGTFLFWKVTDQNIQNYDYYKFIENYDTSKKYNDDKIESFINKQEIISVLDGQQRLTSLNIGLKGTYTNNKLQYLYINLSQMNDSDDVDDIQTKYLFKFKTEAEIEKDSDKWFKVGNILTMSNGDVTMYAIKNQLTELGINILSELHNVIHERTVINYYLISENDIDKVLNIFVRINKGGTYLSYSDLLLSIATSKWNQMSARDEINKLIEEVSLIDGEFSITKDFILKTSLLLIDANIKFTSKNLKTENMRLMENNWENIRIAIIKTFVFFSENNFDNKSLPSINVASFIAYFFFTNSIKNIVEGEELKSFILKSLLKSVYSSSIDTVLEQGRKYLQSIKDNNNIFNSNQMLESIKLKNTFFREEDICSFSRTKRTQKSFMLLMTRLFESKNLHGMQELISRDRASRYNGVYKEHLNAICNYRFNKITDIYSNSTVNIDVLNDNEIDVFLEKREKSIINRLKVLLN